MPVNLTALLKLNKCTVIPSYASPIRDGNSSFVSLPPLRISEVFSDISAVELSANFVHIDGYGNEPVHHHISHVIGAIINGEAVLKTDSKDIPVKTGDVVVIPRGAKHEFVCEEGTQMDYVAYEVADTSLDFKKHF